MGTGETAEGHRIQSLAGEAGIPDAIKVLNPRAVERHRQQAGQLHRRNRPITALESTQEAAVAPRCSDLPVGDGIVQAGRIASSRWISRAASASFFCLYSDGLRPCHASIEEGVKVCTM